MKKRQIRNSLILLLTAVIWGVTFVAQSVGMDHVGPFTFNCVRSLIGGAVLIPSIALLRKLNTPKKKAKNTGDAREIAGQAAQSESNAKKAARQADNARKAAQQADSARKAVRPADNARKAAQPTDDARVRERRALLKGGFCCGAALAVATSLQQIGIVHTSVGKAGFITAFYIVIVPVLGWFLGRKCGPTVWVGVLLALVGLYFLCISEDFTIGEGDVYIFASALCFSVHILLIDHFSPQTDGVTLSCVQFLVCGTLCAVPMFLFEHPQIGPLLAAWKPILYAGVFSCGVAYTLQVVGQKGMDPTVASLILSLESVVSAISGALLLGQHLNGREMVGCALIFAAIILAELPMPKKLRAK